MHKMATTVRIAAANPPETPPTITAIFAPVADSTGSLGESLGSTGVELETCEKEVPEVLVDTVVEVLPVWNGKSTKMAKHKKERREDGKHSCLRTRECRPFRLVRAAPHVSKYLVDFSHTL